MNTNHLEPWKLSFGKIVDSEGRALCQLIKRPDTHRTIATAKLMAAAPDLYTALVALLEDHHRMFLEAHPNSTIKWSGCEEVKAACAAITKAEATTT